MTKSPPCKTNTRQARLLGAVLATSLLTLGTTHAQVAVPSTVAFDIGTGLYSYSYSVMNNGPTFDLAIVNIPVGSAANPMTFTSPSGFEISFDPGVGIVSFFEDADPGTLPTFAPSTTRGLFTYKSSQAPVSVMFDALDAGGNTFTGFTMAPVPEPGAMSLIFLSALASAVFSRRRQSAA